MGPLGAQELIFVFLLALVLFGPKKLPELGRTLGKAMTEFRRAKNELKSTFETHLQELEKETRSATDAINSSTDFSSTNYPYPYDDYDNYDSDPDSAAAHETSENESSKEAVAAAPRITEGGDQPSPNHSPVAGTVPRSNGVHPVESGSVAAHQEHPA